MAEPRRSAIASLTDDFVGACRDGWKVLRHRGPSQVQFWFIALAIGIAAGFAAVVFRKSISALQGWIYRTDESGALNNIADNLPWYWILLIPVAGGLAVGLILHVFTNDARVRSVADVIEGAALHDGRVERKAGIASALASLITLSTGGSTGREGPVVHIAGVRTRIYVTSAPPQGPATGAPFAPMKVAQVHSNHSGAPMCRSQITKT